MHGENACVFISDSGTVPLLSRPRKHDLSQLHEVFHSLTLSGRAIPHFILLSSLAFQPLSGSHFRAVLCSTAFLDRSHWFADCCVIFLSLLLHLDMRSRIYEMCLPFLYMLDTGAKLPLCGRNGGMFFHNAGHGGTVHAHPQWPGEREWWGEDSLRLAILWQISHDYCFFPSTCSSLWYRPSVSLCLPLD